VISKRLKIQGFLAFDHAAKMKEMVSNFIEWHALGKLKYRVDIVRGLEAAPTAINKLFDGSNHGKLIVQISDAPTAS
jgi:NADPH-dependent curcumin reductase CurA